MKRTIDVLETLGALLLLIWLAPAVFGAAPPLLPFLLPAGAAFVVAVILRLILWGPKSQAEWEDRYTREAVRRRAVAEGLRRAGERVTLGKQEAVKRAEERKAALRHGSQMGQLDSRKFGIF